MSQLPDDVRIRRAVSDDLEELVHLHLDCWDDAYTGLVPQRILDDRRRPDAVTDRVDRWRLIVDQADRLLVAEGPAGLIGFVLAGEGRDNDVDVALELQALYVRAAWWGTGVGYALLEEAIGDRAAYLWALAGNERALRFYERQGFRLDGTRDEQDEGLHVRMVRAGV